MYFSKKKKLLYYLSNFPVIVSIIFITVISKTAVLFILKIVIAGSFFPHYFIQGTLDETEVLREVNENDPLSTVAVS